MERIPHCFESPCVVCAARQGEIHRLGCPGELCPTCGRHLLSCSCMTFDAETNARMVRILYNEMRNDLAEAWMATSCFPWSSPICTAAWIIIGLHHPEQIQRAKFFNAFGAAYFLKPSAFHPDGTAVFSVRDIVALVSGSQDRTDALIEAFQDVEADVRSEDLCLTQ